MKIRIMSNIIRLYVAVLLFSFGVVNAEAGDFNSISADQIPDILTMISDKTRSNYDRIQTWQGKVDFTVDTIYQGPAAERVFNENTDGKGEIPKSVRKHKEGNIQFAVDTEKGFVYENLFRPNPVQYTELETGRSLIAKSSVSWHTISIITPEYFIHSTPIRYAGTSIASRKAIKEAPQQCSTCVMSGVFDPRKCFGVRGAVWQILPLVIQKIKEDGKFSVGEYDLEVEERAWEGSTEYRIQIPLKSPETYAFATMVFSSEEGFNIISYQIADQQGKFLQKLSWDYGLVDGVYLPTKTEKQNFDRQTGHLSYQEEFVFKNSQINHVIPQETFTYKNLGLENGDKFIDKIQGREYTYQDEELIPTSSGSSRIFKQVDPTADLNGDCCMNWQDLIILASHWLES